MTAYLDHAASSPLRPEALAAMRARLETFGNPSSIHRFGREARKALDESREKIAAALRCDPREIVLTSCATEANNLAVLGTARSPRPGRLVATAVEHASVLEACRASGREFAFVKPGEDGRVDAEEVDPRGAALVSMMLVNNETGALQPVTEVAYRAREAGAWVHCDAVQALGKFPIDLSRLPVDLLTISSHKAGGPKGAGGLFVRKGVRPAPLLVGGGQEFERRAGTENAAAAAGFAAAVEAAAAGVERESARMAGLTERLRREIIRSVPGVALNGPAADRAPHILNLSFEGADGEALVAALDAEGIAVSTGSACASLATEASHVLLAMGLSPGRVRGSIRFSVGPSTTDAEADALLAALPRLVGRVREAGGAA